MNELSVSEPRLRLCSQLNIVKNISTYIRITQISNG